MRWPFFSPPPCLLRRVTVNFTHDATEAMQGALWEYRRGWITLRDVSALKAGQPPVPIVGDVVISERRIAFFQVLP